MSAAYPAVWGLGQMVTGALSDRIGRKGLIVGGMVIQGIALVTIALGSGFGTWLLAAIVLGVGTAMVYPTLLAVIVDVAEPAWRGAALGVYRLWRDLGFAVGAILAGLIADRFGMPVAIGTVGGLTVASGLVAARRLAETHPRRGARPLGFGPRAARPVSPCAAHASNPPTTSVARSNPRSIIVAAARLDEWPWAHRRIARRAGSETRGSA
ncbi:MAG: MFS transporter [Candidatus Limnocylindrales bacterium]